MESIDLRWLLQLKDLPALLGLMALIWFTYTKHIPFLVLQLTSRFEKEMTRLCEAHQKEMERVATSHARDQAQWTASMDRSTTAIEKLESSIHSLVQEMREVTRGLTFRGGPFYLSDGRQKTWQSQ